MGVDAIGVSKVIFFDGYGFSGNDMKLLA